MSTFHIFDRLLPHGWQRFEGNNMWDKYKTRELRGIYTIQIAAGIKGRASVGNISRSSQIFTPEDNQGEDPRRGNTSSTGHIEELAREKEKRKADLCRSTSTKRLEKWKASEGVGGGGAGVAL